MLNQINKNNEMVCSPSINLPDLSSERRKTVQLLWGLLYFSF